MIPLSDKWAKRQFVILVREKGLSLPAQLLVQKSLFFRRHSTASIGSPKIVLYRKSFEADSEG